MTGAGFWNVSPVWPFRPFRWTRVPLDLQHALSQIRSCWSVMSQARLRSLRIGRGEKMFSGSKFPTPRRERKRARCRVDRVPHLEQAKSSPTTLWSIPAVARGSMWSSPREGASL